MDREDLEFRISQYADGTLPASEVVALETTLAGDADARALLDEYRALNAALKRELVVPAMDYDRLAAHLSEAVAEEDAATTTIAWPLRWHSLAAAASIVIIIGTAALWMTRPREGGATEVVVNAPPAPAAVALVEVTGPVVQAAPQPIEEITLGPSPLARQTNYGVAEEVVYRPPRLMIASGPFDRQDTQRLPF